jgi:predicted AAA+ superfamily ATPase
MRDIPRQQIEKRLAAENPWWRSPNRVPDLYGQWSPRPYLDLFFPLLANRSVRRAIVLMGPRRVGKTVLIHHAIERLLKAGTPPSRICYVSLDNPVYVNCSLEQILELFSEATGTDLATGGFVFFDEVQYLRNWEQHLKVIVDTLPGLKCVASGSAAAALRLKSDESGAGRFTDFLLPPLTFHEYLSLVGEHDLVDIEALNQRFVHYLNFGGYPEAVFSSEIQADPARFIKSDIIDKVLLRDLPSLYGIRDIQELNALFTTLAYNTAQEISLEQLSKQSGVAKNTIKRYIDYLEAAFLIRVVHRVDKNARYFQRANYFKVYLTNPSIRAALFAPVGADDEEIGSLVETGIFAQWFHSAHHEDLHYARWKNGEIDMVHLGEQQEIRWAVEVKWSDRYANRPSLLTELIGFCHRNNVKTLLVTSRTKQERGDIMSVGVEFWPAAVYCFAVGYNILQGLTIRDTILALKEQAPRTRRAGGLLES